jgi:hypothetical protein
MPYFNSWTPTMYVGYKILMEDLLLNVGLSSSLFRTLSGEFHYVVSKMATSYRIK